MLSDWEPLLPDSRVERIAELIRLAEPELVDAEFATFIVPRQVEKDRRRMKYAPHESGCSFGAGNPACECGPLEIPEQAMFTIKTAHPRTWDPIYKGKDLMTFEGTWLPRWREEERLRAHYVSTREDPAFEIFAIAAKAHAKKMRGYRALI